MSSLKHDAYMILLKEQVQGKQACSPILSNIKCSCISQGTFSIISITKLGKGKKTYVDCDMLFVFSCCCSAGTFSAVAVDERCESERLRLKSGELKLEPKIIQFSMPCPPSIYLSMLYYVSIYYVLMFFETVHLFLESKRFFFSRCSLHFISLIHDKTTD